MITAQDGFNFAFGVFQFALTIIGIVVIIIILYIGLWFLYRAIKILFNLFKKRK